MFVVSTVFTRSPNGGLPLMGAFNDGDGGPHLPQGSNLATNKGKKSVLCVGIGSRFQLRPEIAR